MFYTFGLIQVEFEFLQWFAIHIQYSSALLVFMISDVSRLICFASLMVH